MPRALPLVAELLPPVDGRPLSRGEWSEQRAIRLALVMVTVVFHQQEFLPRHRPIPGGHDSDMRWLHQNLEPLARISPTVRRLRQVFDQRLYGREWYDPLLVRRNLRLGAMTAVSLASQIQGGPPQRQPKGVSI